MVLHFQVYMDEKSLREVRNSKSWQAHMSTGPPCMTAEQIVSADKDCGSFKKKELDIEGGIL